MQKTILRISCTLIFVILQTIAFAQIPAGYYNAAAGLHGTALQAALHNIIKNHTVISYGNLYTQFKITDTKGSNVVWDMYSDVPGGTPPYTYHYVSSDECGSYVNEGDCFNREHSFPQSLFGSTGSIYSDLFHLYPTDGKVNGERSNYPMGEVDTASWTSLNGSKVGICTFNDSLGHYYPFTAFEPIDAYKGDFARTYFYIAVRYYTEDAGWTSNGMNNGSQMKPWAIAQYLKWSHNDPVSTKETDRNNAIYGIQHNRNPFIDHPEWADSIWASVVSGIVLTNINAYCDIYPNPALTNVNVRYFSTERGPFRLDLFSADGRCILVKSSNKIADDMQETIDLSEFPQGVYYLRITTGSNALTKKIVLQ